MTMVMILVRMMMMVVVVLANKKWQLREFSRRLFFKTERSASLLHSAADDDHDDH